MDRNHLSDEDLALLVDSGYESARMEDGFRRELQRKTRRIAAAKGYRARRWRLQVLYGVGVAAVLLAMALCVRMLQPMQGPSMKVMTARGVAENERGHALRVGDRLRPGHMIRTGRDGKLTFATKSGSELFLQANSEVLFSTESSVTLRKGRLYCINRLHEFKVIETPAGKVRLLGTTVDVAVLKDSRVVVTVVDGKVEIANRLGKALVNAGKRSVLMASAVPNTGTAVYDVGKTAWCPERYNILSDGGKIVYTVERPGSLLTEIWVMDADGSNKRLVKSYVSYHEETRLGSWLSGTEKVLIRVSAPGWPVIVKHGASRMVPECDRLRSAKQSLLLHPATDWTSRVTAGFPTQGPNIR